MSKNNKLIRWLTWLLALVLFALVLTRMPLADVLDAITSLSPLQWLAWLVINVSVIYLFVWRWQVLVRPLDFAAGTLDLLKIRQAGQTVSFITPGPQFGGEPLQVYWLWNKYSMSGPSAFLAVSLDRFIELWINFAVLLIGLLLLFGSTTLAIDSPGNIAGILLILLILLSLGGWLLLTRPAIVSERIRILARRWQHHSSLLDFETHWENFTSQLNRLIRQHKSNLLVSLVLSLLGWTGMILELGLLLLFIDIHLSPAEFILLLVATRLAFLLPLPGGIGTLEAAVYWVFVSLDLSLNGAAGLIAMMRFRDIIVLSYGLYAFRHLQNAAERQGGARA